MYLTGHTGLTLGGAAQMKEILRSQPIFMCKGSSTSKIWLEPEVMLANSLELKASELNELEDIIRQKQDVFKEAWYAYFGSYGSSQEGLDRFRKSLAGTY